MLAVVLAVVSAIVTAGLAAVAPPASACSCAGGSSIRDYARGADDVLVARVVGTPRSTGGEVAAPARVRLVYQGRTRTHLRVVTASSGASCGVRLRAGQTWIFFTDSRRGRAEVSLCGGNRLATERTRKAVARALGRAHEPC